MLTADFKEFAALLNSNGVKYLVVGGYALAAYGHPRYTGDMDFWIGTAADNADKVLLALDQFGFKSWGCGANLGLVYVANPRLSRYSMGLSEPSDILIRFSLYQ